MYIAMNTSTISDSVKQLKKLATDGTTSMLQHSKRICEDGISNIMKIARGCFQKQRFC